MPPCGIKLCLFANRHSKQTHKQTHKETHKQTQQTDTETDTQTDTRMHTVIDAFNCRFVFSRWSLDHVREVLTFVRDVIRLTKTDTTPPLQLQELRKLVETYGLAATLHLRPSGSDVPVPRQITEVKHRRAGLVPGWVTTREHPVL